jgi:deferrochelatase/peroxidase EfeB
MAGSGLAAAAVLVAGLRDDARAAAAPGVVPAAATPGPVGSVVPFVGDHQSGIATRQQGYLAFAVYDLATTDLATVAQLLSTWTSAAGRMTAGLPLEGDTGRFVPPPDSGEAGELGASRLTLTVGFGPGMFDERLGLGSQRPAALAPLPAFAGDQLDPARSGGDLCIQACADDPRVAFHAVRNLTRLGAFAVTLRYVQIGSGSTTRPAVGAPPPRNLLGFHDGTANVDPDDEVAMRSVVWVGDGDRPWMRGGSYLVARRVRIHLESWDRSTLEEQEQTIGRSKATGAPLSGGRFDDPADFEVLGSNGQPLIPNGAHIRQASPSRNGGVRLLRRGYGYVDGLDAASGEPDAGLFFICFQRDPSRQFVPIQRRLSENDTLTSYLVHTGSGVFACPPGVGPGQPWGLGLLRAAGA